MIKSFKHRGLERFYTSGSMAGIQSAHKIRLQIILQRLDAAVAPNDMDLPGMRFHSLRGNKKGFYSVKVNGNWRVIFKFEKSDVILVDYLDYH